MDDAARAGMAILLLGFFWNELQHPWWKCTLMDRSDTLSGLTLTFLRRFEGPLAFFRNSLRFHQTSHASMLLPILAFKG